MELFEFFRWSVLIIGIFVVIVVLYLVGLINKRRRAKFLHQQNQPDSHSNFSSRSPQ